MVKDIEKYVRYWRRRFQDEQGRSKEREQQRLAVLPQAVEILKKYGARKIILFGSLAKKDRFIYKRSDIDLAVEGIPDDKFLSALGDLMLSLPFLVDLKPLEDVDAFFRKRILESGKVIYEQKE